MSFPKPDEASKAFFESIVPDRPDIEIRPMFGNYGAFVNGNMFLSLFGSEVAVRLSEDDRATLLAVDGAVPFEPMEGRPMKEYVSLPEAWRSEPDTVAAWVERSLEWVGAMPPKRKKKK